MVRDELGATGISTHFVPKTVATLIDDEGLSARIGAYHLGHSKVSMTRTATCRAGGCIPPSPSYWTAPSTMNKR